MSLNEGEDRLLDERAVGDGIGETPAVAAGGNDEQRGRDMLRGERVEEHDGVADLNSLVVLASDDEARRRIGSDILLR